MPAIHTFLVTRTETIRVRSTNPHDAIKAGVHFMEGTKTSVERELGVAEPGTYKVAELSAKDID